MGIRKTTTPQSSRGCR